ncbi:MAG: 23S rRNA (pseudouridine(1915)-N(3))-methyltransferase RlmH [Ruminococcaceae bacterium]|nr:23S rRNA (pseudouridine(1915)-N(3))-methyltransferase RlmH [Oscillospiraceae bacterium]
MKIKLICVGKLKEAYLRDAVAEYSKRLGRFCTLEVVELPDEKIPERASQAQMEKVIATEGERIAKHIGAGEFVVPMCIEGKQLASEQFAKTLAEVTLRGMSTVTFIIGGSLGIADHIKKQGDFKLSLSAMTLPHQLARVVLLEQIYRAFKINAGQEYHK